MKQAAAMLAVTMSSMLAASTLAVAGEYHASPQGDGDGLSASTPFQIGDFWKVAQPGDTLMLLDGHYTGGDSMINPPRGLNGDHAVPACQSQPSIRATRRVHDTPRDRHRW